jgi:hypothetical protein
VEFESPYPDAGATPPDSAGNGRADPAETPLRTALSSGCSQSRCADQAAPRPVQTAVELRWLTADWRHRAAMSGPRLPDMARAF